MAADRIAVLRELFSAWAQGDFRSPRRFMSEDVESIWGEPPGEDIVCHGSREVAERFGDFLGNWTEFRVDLEELTQLDEDNVLAVAVQRATGASSGVETEMRVYIAFKFAGDEIAGTYWFIDREKSLRLAGFGPSAG